MSEALSSLAFRHSATGLAVVDGHGKVVEANDAARRLLLREAVGLVGYPIPGLDVSDGAARSQRLEVEGDRAVAATLNAVPEAPDDLSAPRWVVDLRDVTEELALHRQTQRLQRVVDQTPDFIGMASVDGRLIYQNRAANRLVGWPEDEDVDGRRVPDVHPEWAARRVESTGIPHAVQHGSWSGETALLGPHGEVPVSQVILVHRDDRGAPEYLSTIMRDLTGEQAARARLDKLVSRVPGLVFEVVAAGEGPAHFRYASHGIARIYGVPEAELLNSVEPVEVRIHPEDLRATRRAFDDAAREGRHGQVEFRYDHPSRGLRWLRSEFVPESTADEVRWYGYISDITDDVQIREQLEGALHDARAATTAKSVFLATMSHEIRTPLNGVIGMTELLAGTQLDADQREFVETIRQSGEGLLTLLNDILDFSKLEAGAVTLEALPFSPEELAGGVVQLLKESASRKHLTLECRVDASTPRRLRGDAARVRQVLLNLVANAVKFTEEGGVVVELSAPGGGDGVDLVVTDTGIGMSPTELNRVGEAFAQADASTTRRFGGTGLGLTICRQLVELMGGQLNVASEAGAGTSVRVTLPLETVEDATPALAPPAPVSSPARFARILVAEDNKMNQRLLRHVLKAHADAVDFVDDGAAAVAATAETRYDLILMDGQMPVMDGPEAARRIRAHERAEGRPSTPIVALTASAMPGDREAFLNAGMDEYLSKPLRPQDLARVLATLVD